MRQLKITKSITNRELPSLDKYLQEIAREEMIQPYEEVELACKIREGDQKALEKLVRANLRFVVSVAKQYQNQGLSLSDLINEGNIGLIKAAKRFDETRGFKFISYAVSWIRQSILEAIGSNSRIVRLPQNKVAILRKIKKVVAIFEQENERKPSESEIAEILEEDIYVVIDVLCASNNYVGIDSPFTKGEENSLVDILINEDSPSPDNYLIFNSLKIIIKRYLNVLREREREIIEMSFGLGDYQEMSLLEISERLGVTKERVRQVRKNALRRLYGHRKLLIDA
jgi:RNA polymerase primary sigma factor